MTKQLIPFALALLLLLSCLVSCEEKPGDGSSETESETVESSAPETEEPFELEIETLPPPETSNPEETCYLVELYDPKSIRIESPYCCNVTADSYLYYFYQYPYYTMDGLWWEAFEELGVLDPGKKELWNNYLTIHYIMNNQQLPEVYRMIRHFGIGKEDFIQANELVKQRVLGLQDFYNQLYPGGLGRDPVAIFTEEDIDFLYSHCDLEIMQAVKGDHVFYYDGVLYPLNYLCWLSDDCLYEKYKDIFDSLSTGVLYKKLDDAAIKDMAKHGLTLYLESMIPKMIDYSAYKGHETDYPGDIFLQGDVDWFPESDEYIYLRDYAIKLFERAKKLIE